jgi:hypothetical protein
MFDFAKRGLVLWLALANADFAFDRFAAGYSEQLGGTKAAQSGSIDVPVAAAPAP